MTEDVLKGPEARKKLLHDKQLSRRPSLSGRRNREEPRPLAGGDKSRRRKDFEEEKNESHQRRKRGRPGSEARSLT